MKKIFKFSLVLALSAAALFSLASCGSDSGESSLVGGGDAATDINVTTDTDKTTPDTDKTPSETDNDKSEDKDEEENTKTIDTSSDEEDVKVKPTFKYFVSKSDKDYDKTMKTVDELKETYKDKVVFDIVDVEEQPEALENFAMVKGNTPYLIMLNTSNDICALSPKLTDKAELEKTIEGALE